MNVLVINHYAGNKGDRAVLHFLIRELKRHAVDEIVISAHDRSLWKDHREIWGQEVGLVPWGWNVEQPAVINRLTWRIWWERRRIYKKLIYPWVRKILIHGGTSRWVAPFCNRQFMDAVKSADFVISTGGHHLTTLLAPDAVSSLLYDLAMVQISKKPLVLWSQSMGPFNFEKDENRKFTGRLLSNADMLFIRDKQSLDELKTFGLQQKKIFNTYDSVFGLNDEVTEYTAPSRRPPVIGMAVYAAQQRSDEEASRYIGALARFVDYLCEAGYRIKFYPMELKGVGTDDRELIMKIVSTSRHRIHCQIMDEDLDTMTLLKEIANCRMFIGHKTHSVVFSLTAGTPVIALAYHKKTRDFMEQFDLGEFAIPDDLLSFEKLKEKFEQLKTNLDEASRKEWARSKTIGEAVRTDFSRMLALMEADS